MTTEEQQLVERLRAFAASFDHDITLYEGHPAVLAREAADTITRLVEERDRWEAACDGNTALGAEIAETLKSRIDMLEADRNAGRSVYLTLQQSAAVVVKRLSASEAKVAELQEALKPFARVADMEERAEAGASVMVNVSRCRDARRALERSK